MRDRSRTSVTATKDRTQPTVRTPSDGHSIEYIGVAAGPPAAILVARTINELENSGGRQRKPRNHRGRGTDYLSEAAALNAVEACAFAEKHGLPFSHFFSIHLEKGEITGRAQSVVGHYFRMASQWLAYHDVPPTYVWWLEHAIDDVDSNKGLHVHALIHVPRRLGHDFRKLAREQWAHLAGINPLPKVVHIKPVGPKRQRYYDREDGPSETRRSSIKGAMRYLLKSLNPSKPAEIIATGKDKSVATLLGIRTVRSLTIYGLRLSLSRNIGKKARLEWLLRRVEASTKG